MSCFYSTSVVKVVPNRFKYFQVNVVLEPENVVERMTVAVNHWSFFLLLLLDDFAKLNNLVCKGMHTFEILQFFGLVHLDFVN